MSKLPTCNIFKESYRKRWSEKGKYIVNPASFGEDCVDSCETDNTLVKDGENYSLANNTSCSFKCREGYTFKGGKQGCSKITIRIDNGGGLNARGMKEEQILNIKFRTLLSKVSPLTATEDKGKVKLSTIITFFEEDETLPNVFFIKVGGEERSIKDFKEYMESTLSVSDYDNINLKLFDAEKTGSDENPLEINKDCNNIDWIREFLAKAAELGSIDPEKFLKLTSNKKDISLGFDILNGDDKIDDGKIYLGVSYKKDNYVSAQSWTAFIKNSIFFNKKEEESFYSCNQLGNFFKYFHNEIFEVCFGGIPGNVLGVEPTSAYKNKLFWGIGFKQTPLKSNALRLETNYGNLEAVWKFLFGYVPKRFNIYFDEYTSVYFKATPFRWLGETKTGYYHKSLTDFRDDEVEIIWTPEKIKEVGETTNTIDALNNNDTLDRLKRTRQIFDGIKLGRGDKFEGYFDSLEDFFTINKPTILKNTFSIEKTNIGEEPYSDIDWIGPLEEKRFIDDDIKDEVKAKLKDGPHDNDPFAVYTFFDIKQMNSGSSSNLEIQMYCWLYVSDTKNVSDDLRQVNLRNSTIEENLGYNEEEYKILNVRTLQGLWETLSKWGFSLEWKSFTDVEDWAKLCKTHGLKFSTANSYTITGIKVLKYISNLLRKYNVELVHVGEVFGCTLTEYKLSTRNIDRLAGTYPLITKKTIISQFKNGVKKILCNLGNIKLAFSNSHIYFSNNVATNIRVDDNISDPDGVIASYVIQDLDKNGVFNKRRELFEREIMSIRPSISNRFIMGEASEDVKTDLTNELISIYSDIAINKIRSNLDF